MDYLRAPREVLADDPRIFHDHFGTSRPNHTHEVLTKWEARVPLKALVTQNTGNPLYATGFLGGRSMVAHPLVQLAADYLAGQLGWGNHPRPVG